MSASDGKPACAPCGCPGRYVIGQYIECLGACAKRCPKCTSRDVRPFVAAMCPANSYACNPCGAVFRPAINAAQ